MSEAASGYVDVFDLQRAAGARLAQLTRNDAAYVATGAAAGMFLATLACGVGGDPVDMARFMETGALIRDEVIIHRVHRIPYEPALRLAGARLVEIGNVFHTSPADLEAAITERTAHVFYVPGAHIARGALTLGRDDRDRACARRAGDRRCRRAAAAGRKPLALHRAISAPTWPCSAAARISRSAIKRPGVGRADLIAIMR